MTFHHLILSVDFNLLTTDITKEYKCSINFNILVHKSKFGGADKDQPK